LAELLPADILHSKEMPPAQTKRVFIAAFPSTPVVEKVESAVAELAKHIPPGFVRWTRAGDIHLTLNFLGNVDCARLPELHVALKAACEPHRPHAVYVAGMGCFPKPSRPQILWVGLTGNLHPLEMLKKSIDKEFSCLGFVPEKRAFHPHLTIGRATNFGTNSVKQIAQALKLNAERDFGHWRIEHVDLMQSTLSPRGAIYKTLAAIPLKAP
jgi:2'-5' RNA ligase